MDTETINTITQEGKRQHFLEEKSAIRAIANRKISSTKKQALVKLVKFPKMVVDDSYLAGKIF